VFSHICVTIVPLCSVLWQDILHWYKLGVIYKDPVSNDGTECMQQGSTGENKINMGDMLP